MKLLHYTLIVPIAFLSVCNADEPAATREVSFGHEVMAVLSKSGCNLGTCHGNANGKGGLKLSLRGQDPETDFLTLTRSVGARRVTPLDPAASLLLQKPTMLVPHEGGRRFSTDSLEYQLLRDWIGHGLKSTQNESELIALKIVPQQKTIISPATSVQLSVTAVFQDGGEKDVTRLAVYEPSSLAVQVSPGGMVRSERSGLTDIVVRYLHRQAPVRLEFIDNHADFVFDPPEVANFVDEAVFDQLRRLRINPAQLCDDSTFIRRAYLDLTGLLPPPDEAKTFLASKDVDKRSQLIDRLLDSNEFSDFMSLRWADLLRVESKTLDEKGMQHFYDWIHDSFAQRKPLHEFAAQIVEARGSTYKVPPTNFYRSLRKPALRAEAVAQVFLGIRLQCAKCHNHPFGRWTQDDYYAWTNFFERVDYKIIENKRRDKSDKNEFVGEQIVQLKDSGDTKIPGSKQVAGLRFLGNDADDVDESSTAGDPPPDRLKRLGTWFRSANERFAATQANRIWAQLMGRGIVDPIDDFRSTNPPVNPVLLDRLAREFAESKYDVRHLMRIICNSKTWQLASEPSRDSMSELTFAHNALRRLTAEQTLDAISTVLDVPVKFGGHDKGVKAVQIKGVRNGGHRYAKPEIGDSFLKLFGKPNRVQTCDCERSEQTTLAQTFELVSGKLVNHMLQKSGGNIDRWATSKNRDKVVAQVYWVALSRSATETEARAATSYLESSGDDRAAIEDLVWAILNSNEFLLRH